jgi:hypothetical protein
MYPIHIMVPGFATTARLSLLCGAGISALIIGSALPANALLTFNFQEVGTDVVLTTSGSFSTGTLPTPSGSTTSNLSPFIQVAGGNINTGVGGSVTSSNYRLAGPNFTLGTTTGTLNPTASSGDRVRLTSGFGTALDPKSLQIFDGYTLGTPINASMTFAGSFASLGLKPVGTTFTYQFLDGGVDAVTVTFTEIPAPLPLLGLAAAFSASRRLRKKTATLA